MRLQQSRHSFLGPSALILHHRTSRLSPNHRAPDNRLTTKNDTKIVLVKTVCADNDNMLSQKRELCKASLAFFCNGKADFHITEDRQTSSRLLSRIPHSKLLTGITIAGISCCLEHHMGTWVLSC